MSRAQAAIVCLGLTFSLTCGLAFADVEHGADAASLQDPIPSRLCRNLFFVPVTLAERPGYPRARTLWFVYDTGNNHTVVDPDSVERVTGRDLDGVERVTFTDATTGPVTWNRLPATLRQLDHLSLALGVEIDGILAYRDFGEFLVTLDYELGELRLGAGRLPEPDGDTVFDARGTDERPWLDVTFSRGGRRMLIDSGANSATLSVRDLGSYATQAPPRASGAVLKINRVERSLSARAAGEVLLGAYALPAPVLDETRGTELIGAEVMRHFHWTFDPVRQRVRIERRTPASALAFGPLEDHGLVLVPDTEGNSLRVHEVIPETAAAESGVRPGDRVVAIDGRPVRARGCDWTKGRTMALTLDRDGERLDVEVPMTRFVD